MSWTCQCAEINPDGVRICSRCGHPFEYKPEPAPPPPPPPTYNPPTYNPPIYNSQGYGQPTRAAKGGLGWKIGVIAGVLVLGGIFGLILATTDSHGGARGSGQTSSSPGVKSAFWQSFDASFQRSCRASALRSGRASQDVVDRYCDCALAAFHETRSMSKAAERCRQYIPR